ncbi:outer membrane protein [Reyranella sp.]|uniref:outer membrane protein n=1 Tax=Reyranella sp. TaxID=1929291 RepID=UPI003BA88836
MKRKIGSLCIAAVAATAYAWPAHAQTSPVSIPEKDFGPVWTGFYVGAAFGAGGMVNRLNSGGAGVASSFDGGGASGVLGSIYGGVDYQITQRGVLGLMAELSYGGGQGGVNAQTPGAVAGVNQYAGLGWAVLARTGFLASPTTLLYLTGGYTGLVINTSSYASGFGATANFSGSSTVNGWTVGPGFETMLADNLSAKLEYRYSQYGTANVPGTAIAMQPSTHAVRAGLTYRFGGLGVVSSANSLGSARQAMTNWTGVYGGVAAGGGMGFGSVRATATPGTFANFDNGGQGLIGGFFGGADWQFAPQALVGILADFSWMRLRSTTNINSPVGNAYGTLEANRQWSVMGRVGWLPMPSTLIYAAGGYSQLNVQGTASFTTPGATGYLQNDNTFSGFTVAPGIETVVTGGWTTRLEYRFSQFEQKDVLPGLSMQPSNHTIRAGLSYKFGIGGSTLVARAEE